MSSGSQSRNHSYMSSKKPKNPTHVRCWVHGNIIPYALADLHHIQPSSTGGSDSVENLTYVCQNCHHSIHRVAMMVENSRNGEANDLAMELYPVPLHRKRFNQAVREVVQASVVAKDLGIQTEDAEIRLALPRDILQNLKILAHEKRVNGKVVGVGRYIEALISQHLRKKGMIL